MYGLLLLCYLLGPPAIALMVCRACQGHRRLLWLGGGLLVVVLLILLATAIHLDSQGGDAVFAWAYILLGAMPLLGAGLILLIGGFVRWYSTR